MKEDFKKTNNGRGLYIALAICILAIICVGVYSAVMNVFKAPQYNSPVPNSTHGKVNVPATTRTPGQTVNQPVQKPVPATTAAVKPSQGKDDISVSVTDPQKRVYTKPITGSVTKDYSDDILVYSVTMNDYRVHTGVDIAAAIGNPVLCLTDGVIKDIYEDPLMGHSVTVDHGDGLVSVYQNLGEVLPQGIAVGAKVKSGEAIAGVGESALIECAESAHLHFEVMKDGAHVNPAEYLELS